MSPRATFSSSPWYDISADYLLVAVFFSSYCGVSRYKQGSELVPASKDEESDMRCLSVREAVNFAKSTNLLGVLLEATTLVSMLRVTSQGGSC